ncbi:hypothetical protein FPQ18DRAFT_387184 [Pyronema domesticum]|nr:hypothetical protein FPQ18DRAFT_387184 [Pyronema domesticum]
MEDASNRPQDGGQKAPGSGPEFGQYCEKPQETASDFSDLTDFEDDEEDEDDEEQEEQQEEEEYDEEKENRMATEKNDAKKEPNTDTRKPDQEINNAPPITQQNPPFLDPQVSNTENPAQKRRIQQTKGKRDNANPPRD